MAKRLRQRHYYDFEWKKNPNAVYVGRPTKYGNPFPLLHEDNREAVVNLYSVWLSLKLKEDSHFLDELKGKDLVCFCPLDKPCHADVLLETIAKLYPSNPKPLLTTPFYTSDDGE